MDLAFGNKGLQQAQQQIYFNKYKIKYQRTFFIINFSEKGVKNRPRSM